MGSYTVTHWVRLVGAMAASSTSYEMLSWEETVDVVAACLLNGRPGWAVGDGWSQPPLPFDVQCP